MPPKWQTKTFNRCKIISNESYDTDNLIDYMFRDPDSVLNQLCDVANKYLKLFIPIKEDEFQMEEEEDEEENWGEEEEGEEGEEVEGYEDWRQDLNDAMLQTSKYFGLNTQSRESTVQTMDQLWNEDWRKFVGFHSVISNMCKFAERTANLRSGRVFILESEELFERTPYDEVLIGPTNKDLFHVKFDIGMSDEDMSGVCEQVAEKWKYAIENNSVLLRWPFDNGSTDGVGGMRWGGTNPDLEAAIDKLNEKTKGQNKKSDSDSDSVSKGEQMAYRLKDLGKDHANVEIDLKLQPNGANVENLKKQKKEDEETIEGRNSLYNIVRHAVQLFELDKKIYVQEDEWGPIKRESTLQTFAKVMFDNIKDVLEEERKKVSGVNYVDAILRGQKKGIENTFREFGRRARDIGQARAKFHYHEGKVEAAEERLKEIKDRMNNKLQESGLKFVFKTTTLNVLALAIKEGEEVFEKHFKELVLDAIQRKNKDADSPDDRRIREWKESIEQWYRIRELAGFSRNVLARNKRMKDMEDTFKEMNNKDAWYPIKMIEFNKFAGRENTNTSRSAEDTRRIQQGKSGMQVREGDFMDMENKRLYTKDRVQAFKELARDMRQLVVGWQAPFVPNQKDMQDFINKVGLENWERYKVVAGEKFPGIGQVGSATFAALQTYASWLAKFLKRVFKNDKSGSIITDILAGSQIKYKKTDNNAAPIIPNAQKRHNPNDLSIKGKVALLIPEYQDGYILLDLYSMYDNVKTRPLFNELRLATLDAKTRLDVEYRTLRRSPIDLREVQPGFGPFRSFVQELNSKRVEFTTRACDFMMEMITRVEVNFASPRILIRQVEEFRDTNPVLVYDFNPEEPRTHFRQIFEELVDDLQKVEQWELRWDAALPHLEVLRREDLYQRLTNPTYDASPFTLMDADSINLPDVNYRYELVSATLGNIPVTLDGYMLKGIDLRFATSDNKFNQLYQKYLEYQTDNEDLQRRENNSMKAVWYYATRETQSQEFAGKTVLIPSAKEVCDAMNALRQFGGRDPVHERLRPTVKLVDDIDCLKYAYFRDVLCLHFQEDKTSNEYTKEKVVQACKNRWQPNDQSEFDKKLRAIYNPNNVTENRRDNTDDFGTLWSNTRFLKSTNKYTLESVYVLDEMIRSYSLLRQTNILPYDQATKDDVKSTRSKLVTALRPPDEFVADKLRRLQLIDGVQRLPVNVQELGTYLDAFQIQLDLEWPPGTARDNLPQGVARYIDAFNTTTDAATKFQYALHLGSQLGIPMYQRPYPRGSTTSVVQEPSYAEFLEAGRQVWLETMLDTLDNTNPKNMYDQDFVRRMSLFQPDEYDDGKTNLDAMQVDRTEEQTALMQVIREEQENETLHLRKKSYIPSEFEVDLKSLAQFFPRNNKRGLETNANLSDQRNNRQRQVEQGQNAQENNRRSEEHYNRWLGMAKQRNSSGWVGAPSFTEADEGSPDSQLISLFHQTNDTGSCFFHSVLINIAMFYSNVDDNQNLHQKYIVNNRLIYKLRQDLIAFYYQTINDLEALNSPNAAENVIPAELKMINQAYEANSPSHPNFHRWQAVGYLQTLLQHFKENYMTEGANDYTAYRTYLNNLPNHPDWPQLNSNSTSMDCLKAYVKNLSLSSTYAYLMDMHMMAHMLKVCIFQYKSTNNAGVVQDWRKTNPLVIGDTRYLTELNRPPILIHHQGMHFMAIAYTHVKMLADKVAKYESENQDVPIPAAQLQQMDVVDDDGVFDIIDVLAPRNGQARRDAGFQP